MLDICLLGTGGMMPLPYRYLTSMMARVNGSAILIDAGEGTQMALRRKGWSPNPIDVICFTHYHADHISGLPGLLLSMGNAERTAPLMMVGPRGLERVVNSLRVIAPGLPFDIVFRELEESSETIAMPGMRDVFIDAFRVNHNVTCYGYSIRLVRAGRFDADAAKALGIPVRFWNPLQKGSVITDGDVTYEPSMVMGPERRGLKVTYVTDSRPCASIVEAAEGSDLFICEGMYGEEDKIADARQKKHMLFREAAELADKAGVKELWLTHYSPSLLHPEDFADAARRVFPATVAAKDGRTVTLRFDGDGESGEQLTHVQE